MSVSVSAVLGSQTQLGNGCIIGSMCNVSSHEILADNTVVYGSRCERRIQLERPPVGTNLSSQSIYFFQVCPCDRL